MDDFEHGGFKDREMRRAADQAASVTLFPNKTIAVALKNFSSHGFAASAPAVMPIGAQIILWVPGEGEYTAEVRWALGGRFGARFNGRSEKDAARTIGRAAEMTAA